MKSADPSLEAPATLEPTSLNITALRNFLVAEGIIAPDAKETYRLQAGGRSNLTYIIDARDRQFVLRRPPLGDSDPRAHDVGREFRILSALYPSGLPVPEPIIHCADPSVIGAQFYVMNCVHGRVVESSSNAADLLTSDRLHELVGVVTDGLVGLHSLDYQALGLHALGKPEGFAARQAHRWREHWKTRQQRSIPALDEVGRRLGAAVAAGLPLDAEAPTLVHGDYNIGNLMISSSGPVALRAILDWEMATIGHPLMDLGLLLTYNGPLMGRIFEVDDAIACKPGFPTTASIAERYAKSSGRSIELLDFFQTLAFFKILVLIEEVRARYQAGKTQGEGYSRLGKSAFQNAEVLVEQARCSILPGLGN